MHIISNESALAHWQALKWLPASALGRLKSRFFREQPGLMNTVLTLTDALATDADGKNQLREEDDPRMACFWGLATNCAILNEIFCREAGRPLRQLTHPEANALADETLDFFNGISAAKPEKINELPDPFSTCSQPHLLPGAVVAQRSESKDEQPRFFRELLTLRVVVEALHRACGDEPATTPRSWDAERIQFALSSQGDPLRREALAACDEFRPALVAAFLNELEQCATDPKASLPEDASLTMHAMFLLARWREESAWPVFRKLFSLPGDISYDLWADLITADGAVLLAMVGKNRRDELRAMVEDISLDEFSRQACLDALTCLVAWGELPRLEQVAWLRELLTGKLHPIPDNEYVLAAVITSVCDLEAWELRPEVESAYELGVADESIINLNDFLRAAAEVPNSEWQTFIETHRPITDVAEQTAWLDEAPLDDEPTLDDKLWPEVDPPTPLEDLRVVADSATPYHAPKKVGRNDPCPCGSGKKYKKCCGA